MQPSSQGRVGKFESSRVSIECSEKFLFLAFVMSPLKNIVLYVYLLVVIPLL